MSAVPKLTVCLTVALVLLNLNFKVNAQNYTGRNISFANILWANEYENNSERLANCIANVLEIASYTLRDDVFITYQSLNTSVKYILEDLIDQVLRHDIMIIKHFEFPQNKVAYVGLKLILIDSYDSFMRIAEDSRAEGRFEQNNNRMLFIIVLMIPDHSTISPFSEMQKLFQLFYNYVTIEVSVVVPISNKINIYTFNPYTPRKCGSTRPLLLRSCPENVQGFHLTDLFPDKIRNMNLCPFEVLAAHLAPFIILNKPFIGAESLTGIDGEILKIISRKLNFSIALSDYSNEIGGEVYDNGTSTGVYYQLHEHQAKLGLGYCECTPNRLRYFASTTSYYQTTLRLLLKDSEGYSSFETVFFPFSTSTWILFLTINILRIILLILKRYQYHKRLHKAIPNMLFIVWCFLTLTFSASYGGLFFTYMFNQPLKPLPKTFAELKEWNYNILTDTISGRVAQSLPELKDILTIRNTTPYQVLMEFEKSTPTRLGVLTNMDTFAYFIKKESMKLDKYVSLDETLTDQMLCMYFPYMSYYPNEFNERITQLHTFGVLTQIARQFVNSVDLPTTKDYRIRQNYLGSSTETLSLNHLKGPFIIFAGCLAIACVVFILEILSLKLKMMRRIFMFFAK